jgi:hypothetical protein
VLQQKDMLDDPAQASTLNCIGNRLLSGNSMFKKEAVAGPGGLVLLMDSITQVAEGDEDTLVVSGSHGGTSSGKFASMMLASGRMMRALQPWPCCKRVASQEVPSRT